MMDRRRALMMVGEQSQPILPAEYQQVKWIEATSFAYISTNIQLGTNALDIYFKYYKQTQASDEACLIGCCYGQLSKIEIGMNATANRIFAFSSSSAQIIDSRVYDNVNDVHVAINSASPYIEISMDTGSGIITGSKTGSNASQIASSSINIFNLRAGLSNIYARIYYARFVRKDGTEIANFVPCYLKSTGKPGMYETVTGTFYSSASTNDFVKGPDV